jgi:predicted RNA binding protein YcfA (HicA-like mRNA interferase family)
MPKYPSMKGRELERLLTSSALGYAITSQRGSHRKLQSPHHPSIVFSYHDGADVSPNAVKKILTQDVGLSEVEALRVLGMKG